MPGRSEPPMAAALEAVGGGARTADLPTWNLGDLYAGLSDAALARDLSAAEEAAQSFALRYEGALARILAEARAGAVLAEAMAAFERIQETLGRIGSFADLAFAADMADAANGKFRADTYDRINAITRRLLFFELEINTLDEAALTKALDTEALKPWQPWFARVRRFKPHQLSDELERFLHDQNVVGSSAWVRLFDETLAGLRFEVRGEQYTSEAALHLMMSPDASMRADAAQALARVFKDNIKTFALILNTLVKEKEIEDRWRRYATPPAYRHLTNEVETEVVDALEAAVRAHFPRLSHRYYTLKARWLGKDKLDFWDRNAPLPESMGADIPWDEARATVLGSYARFSPAMAEIGRRFFDERWIDAPLRAGKAPGAFAHPTVPSVHPYLLLNYQGSARDVMTLAHELGHGVHQVLAGSQGHLRAMTPLTLAETASVFGEMLTFQALLGRTREPEARRALIAGKVEDMLNTVVRQIAFYGFEREVHARRREGELTADDIGRIWLKVQADSLGPAIRQNEGYETFWCYISHFVHAPFYVYAYAFGDCLVNALYARYESEPEGFAARYLDLLSAGGTKGHKELLAPFGLDATSRDFWSLGLARIERMIDLLEREAA